MVSLKTHNIVDYVAAALLIMAPFLFGFADVDAARNVLTMSGFALALYSLFTNYYYSLMKIVPLGAHMIMDVVNGLFLIAAPWILGYRDLITGGQEALHYILGVGVIGLVAVTREKTEEDKVRDGIRIGNPLTDSF